MILVIDRRFRYQGGNQMYIGPSYQDVYTGVSTSAAAPGGQDRRGPKAKGRARLRGRRVWWLVLLGGLMEYLSLALNALQLIVLAVAHVVRSTR